MTVAFIGAGGTHDRSSASARQPSPTQISSSREGKALIRPSDDLLVEMTSLESELRAAGDDVDPARLEAHRPDVATAS